MGIWNERQYDSAWIIDLRKALDGAGYVSTRIVAADLGNWDIMGDMQNNSALAAAVDVVGAHYPSTAPPVDFAAFNHSLWAR